jgi:hypothetical protein
MMRLVIVFLFSLSTGYACFAQKQGRVSFQPAMRDTFSFANRWDYPWDVIREDSGGMFSKIEDGLITAEDTAHLYFTANCTTNVQGGYEVRYAYAHLQADTLTIRFEDGLPAYASNFEIQVVKDRFYFQPRLIYPAARRAGEQVSYEMKKQELVLQKAHYKPGDIVMGRVDIEFEARISVPGKETAVRPFYFNGFLRVPVENNPPISSGSIR